jgi:hypothetical protein
MISQLRKAFEDLAKLDAKTQSAELQLLKNNYGHSVSLLTDVNSNLSYNCVICNGGCIELRLSKTPSELRFLLCAPGAGAL